MLSSRRAAAVAIGVVVALAGCSKGSSAGRSSTTRETNTSTTVSTVPVASTSTAPPTTAAGPPLVPPVPPEAQPEPAGEALPDGVYLAQINSFDNENETLNLNLVDVNVNVQGPDGKPYLVEDPDPFTLRELPLADGVGLFLLPKGAWTTQPVDSLRTFFFALANREERPTPFEADQNSVYAVSVAGGRITQVMQIYLP